MRALLLAALFFCTQTWAQNVLPVPALTARVIDQTATLTSDEVLALSHQLKKIEGERGAQVVVLMIASTQPEDIFSFSSRVANTWKIGRKDIGDGVLMVVAKQDRKLRIEIAKSLEGAIPDVLAGQIITEHISPLFKQGQYASGLQAGIKQLSDRIAGEDLPAPTRNKTPIAQNADLGLDPIHLLLFAIFAIPVLGGIAKQIFGNKLGTIAVGAGAGGLAWLFTASLLMAGGAGLVAVVITLITSLKSAGLPSRSSGGWIPSGGSGGFSGGGYSGGGFGSGGGGNFGGGGASGDW